MKLALHLALIACLFLTSCSNKQKKFERQISQGQCTQALENVPKHDKKLQFLGSVEHGSKKALSYTLTGIGHTVDFLVKFVSGTVVFVGLCGPTMIAVMAADSVNANALHKIRCLTPSGELELLDPKLGKSIRSKTMDWRCPDLSFISQSFRQVAECFRDKGGIENLYRARQALQSVQKSQYFTHCVNKDERANIYSFTATIEKELHDLQLLEKEDN